jgi:hypothetical protein
LLKNNITVNLGVFKMPALTISEIPLSDWKRSLCKAIDYPEFGDQRPIVLPDILTEKMLGFSGLACYETVFVLDGPKMLELEISEAIGGVEVFMNGETLGLRANLPYRFDLSDLAWKGKNYLAIEVAIFINRRTIAAGRNRPCIIGDVRLFTN